MNTQLEQKIKADFDEYLNEVVERPLTADERDELCGAFVIGAIRAACYISPPVYAYVASFMVTHE